MSNSSNFLLNSFFSFRNMSKATTTTTTAADQLLDLNSLPVQDFKGEVGDLVLGLASNDVHYSVVLARVQNLLTAAISWPLDNDKLNVLALAPQSNQVSDPLLVAVLKSFLARNYPPEPPVIEHVNRLLGGFFDLVLRLLPLHNLKVAEALTVLLETKTRFFVQHGHERPEPQFDIPADEWAKLQEWKKTIEFSMWIDVLHHDTWRAAQVVERNETHLRVTYERMDRANDEWVSIESARIMPLHTRSKKRELEQWRKDLVVGGKCDLVDSLQKWYTATLLQYNEETDSFLMHYDGIFVPLQIFC
jgi:hypothetical protein